MLMRVVTGKKGKGGQGDDAGEPDEGERRKRQREGFIGEKRSMWSQWQRPRALLQADKGMFGGPNKRGKGGEKREAKRSEGQAQRPPLICSIPFVFDNHQETLVQGRGDGPRWLCET